MAGLIGRDRTANAVQLQSLAQAELAGNEQA